ncbi:MAG: 16S rRNA (adenine1518-N6/adenine1519-N6)-dimethyltransferase [Parcubacteria group bacterium Gr01-1014_107]|nr:MAG: 16S rRNA (adenine1518-N6/adenine1519-N6)-dimethyltransferase [Parcubacteria group bacterium Gr01-1014_107]
MVLNNTKTDQVMSLKPKKSLGQHFLRSEKVLEKIISESDLSKKDTVLEVGPGLGHLTKKLLERADKVIAVEKDDRLIPLLSKKFASEISRGRLGLVHTDILSFDPSTYLKSKEGYKIVANLPYYLTGKFLRKFLSGHEESKLESMTLLLQKEVAQRIVARDGKESLLSISIKAFGKPHYVATVKRDFFKPRPKVDSAILLIDKVGDKILKGEEQKLFFSIVKRGFSSKRKKLTNNLKALGDSNFWQEAFKNCRLSQNTRAEELSVRDWLCLTKECESE